MTSKLLDAAVASLLLCHAASAATLSITPDRSTYRVGEVITLIVIGDSEGGFASQIYGRLLFDGERAEYIAATQEPLTSFGGIPWTEGPLVGGSGFADAFNQIVGEDWPIDEPLVATVALSATSPGLLEYSWATEPLSLSLRFFGLSNASGGSVTIVPEPSTILLVSIGLVSIGITARLCSSLGRRRRFR